MEHSLTPSDSRSAHRRAAALTTITVVVATVAGCLTIIGGTATLTHLFVTDTKQATIEAHKLQIVSLKDELSQCKSSSQASEDLTTAFADTVRPLVHELRTIVHDKTRGERRDAENGEENAETEPPPPPPAIDIEPFSSGMILVGLDSGDVEFNGHDPAVEVTVSLRAQGTTVWADLDCRMREAGRPGGGNTVASVQRSFPVKDVGRRILRIDGIPRKSTFEWTDHNSQPLNKTFGPAKNFSRLSIVADGVGPDVGRHSGVEFSLHAFSVIVE